MNSEAAQGIARFLDVFQATIDRTSLIAWGTPSQESFLQLVYRAALRRQFEALRIMVSLSDTGHGYAAAMMLRPAFEEAIWCKYLVSLPPETGEEIIKLSLQMELAGLLDAQNGYVGAATMAQLGFSQKFVKVALAKDKSTKAALTSIGCKLGWSNKSPLPTISWLTQKTGTTDLYKYLYHATSRFVHFSRVELIRRAWGRPGDVTITSEHFAEYWTEFSLYWGLRLFMELVDSLENLLDEAGIDIDAEKGHEVLLIFQKLSPVPIITMEELQWQG